MTFPIEKILTVSAGDYIENKTNEIARARIPGPIRKPIYEMRGVHVELGYSGPSLLEAFSEKVPESAEIVVDYKPNGTDAGSAIFFRMASGTALIPKKQ